MVVNTREKKERKDLASFQIANGGERRHVMCVGARSGSNHGCHPGGGKRGRFQEKKTSVSVPVAGPWAAAGARPVYKMYARPSCFSAKF